MSTVLQPDVIDLSRVLGPSLIGTSISTALWGMACIQALVYFAIYGSDRWYTKFFVIVILCLETIHEILYILSCWHELIPRYGDLENLTHNNSEATFAEVVTGVIAALVHGFFILRIWRFSRKNWIFPVILVPPTIWQLVGRIWFTTRVYNKSAAAVMVEGTRKLILNLTLTSTIVDVLIALIMCTLLWRGRTGFYGADRILLTLMSASVSTGACTAIFGLFASIAVVVWPRDIFYAIGAIPTCPLYCNAVLANLNSRKFIARSMASATSQQSRRSTAIQLAHMSSSIGKEVAVSVRDGYH